MYNVAIVGCGSIGVENLFVDFGGYNYSFAGAVLENPQTKLVALIDPDKTKLHWISTRLSKETDLGFNSYAQLGDALEDQRIEIVCCAAGPQANEEVIRKAAEYGIQGLFCEKPLALSLSIADELAIIEEKSGLKIQVDYTRNSDPLHRNIVDFIRNGGLGNLLTVRTLYKGGVMAVFPHTSALLGLLFDKPLEVCGVYSPLLNTRCPEDPNIDGVICYSFAPDNRKINVQVTATGRGEIKNDTYIFEFEFTGTKGRITILENGWRVRYETMELSRVFGSTGIQMPYQTEKVPLGFRADASPQPIVEGLAKLISAIENNTETNCNAKKARDAEEVAHALAISANQRGIIVTLPLSDRTHAFANARAGVKLLKQESGKV